MSFITLDLTPEQEVEIKSVREMLEAIPEITQVRICADYCPPLFHSGVNSTLLWGRWLSLIDIIGGFYAGFGPDSLDNLSVARLMSDVDRAIKGVGTS